MILSRSGIALTITHAFQITLLVIGVAGFGRRISWIDDGIAPPGHSVTFKVRLSMEAVVMVVRAH